MPSARDGVNVHRAIVLDVDFATGFFDDALDVLAARSDQRADLLRIDLEVVTMRGAYLLISLRGSARSLPFQRA